MQKFLKENEVCSKPFCDNEFHLNENEKWFLFQWLRTESRFETEAWATRNWPIGPSSFSCSLSFFHLRLTDIAGRGETVLEKGRACKHLFDQLSLPHCPSHFQEKRFSSQNCQMCSVWGFHTFVVFVWLCMREAKCWRMLSKWPTMHHGVHLIKEQPRSQGSETWERGQMRFISILSVSP